MEEHTGQVVVEDVEVVQGPLGQGMHPRLGIHPSPIDGQAIPVGGRLQRFASEWEAVTSDPWVLSVVRGGYRLEFTASPPPFWGIKATTVPREPAKRAALLQEVEALIRKNAVVAISGPRKVGHYQEIKANLTD